MKSTLLKALGLCLILAAAKAQDFPMNPLPKVEWRESGENWHEVSDIGINPIDNNVSLVNGSGIMYVVASPKKESILSSKKSFEDLKFEFEFLQDDNSEAVLILGNGLEISLNNSWKGKKPLMGSILNAASPDQNVGKASGLWQKAKLIFSQPTGEMPAILEKLTINDVLIYQNVMQPGLKSGAGSIQFKVKKGLFALKNAAYSDYGNSRPVSLSNITYTLKETEGWDHTFEPKSTPALNGSIASLSKDFPNDYKEFIVTFKGDINVQKTDKYAFTIDYQGVSDLKIDGKMVTGSDEFIFRVPSTGLIELTKGKHTFEYKYQRIWWPPGFGIFVSGGDFRPYGLHDAKALPAPQVIGGIFVEPKEKAKIIRSFMKFKDEKRIAVVSVGTNQNRHFSFDINSGSLLYAWKGRFADVTEMWFERGEPQIIQALGQQIEFEGKPNFFLKTETQADSVSLKLDEYYLDEAGLPTFNHLYQGQLVSQKFIPEAEGLKVEVSTENKNFNYVLALAKSIEKIGDTLYKTDDYFLKLSKKSAVKIVELNGLKQLIGEPNDIESFTIIW